jgi:hemoglobin/transferrin/lactoferrin receptor protein
MSSNSPVLFVHRIHSMRRTILVSLFSLILSTASAAASTIAGTAADPSGAPVAGARVTLHNLATGAEVAVTADADGRFRFDGLLVGLYRVAVDRQGFSEDARTVAIADPVETVELAFVLRPGGLVSEVTVTATRGQRDERLVPLRVDTVEGPRLELLNPTSTGDALVQAPNITPVGNGPFQVRPRLRGLDSTRVLVLVDGERLNNARTATDRAGVEVGLVDPDSVSSMEVVSGAGSVLYGTDALSGTINIITNQPQLQDSLRFNYGFNGYYSTNESGRRGNVTLGVSHPRFAVQFMGGLEAFDNYQAGSAGVGEDSRPLHANGTLQQGDTIDDNFGFDFNAFPDPFNAPYVRTSATVPTSAAEGSNINVAGLFAFDRTQTLRVKYIRRHMDDVGFPDFEPPYFFQRVSTPYSNLDRLSARYERQAITSWFTNLKVSAYLQDQKRLLRTEFPVQYPVPSPRFFPINVYRLDILTDNEQHVLTPGVDAQGTFLVARRHVITAGTTIYQDRSQDSRTNVTATSAIGNVALGARGPEPVVFPAPVTVGVPTTTHPTRVPDSRFTDIGLFAQDEWEVAPWMRVVGGLRVDFYSVTTDPTTGYDVETLVRGAQPPIDPASLPDVNGDGVSRTAFTGDLGLVFRLTGNVNALAHYGRSYRHPNLEELLFSGPATVGAIVPNLLVEPETGNNVDVGVKMRTSRYAASLTYFNNDYDGFISTEIVALTPSGPISQAVNFADVRIQGLEATGEVPFSVGPGVVTAFGSAAWTHGTVLDGANPLTGASLAGTPQDNISPFKAIAGVRFNDNANRYWVEYGGRVQTDVERVAATLIDSPYLIAQDLYGLDGFFVQRLAGGVNFRPRTDRLGLVFAIENLTDEYYREQFQFAPARGRTFTFGVNLQGF